jgi:2,4-dienoyl-CoA reductase-like NADH-dependent reductase (Old Yellow Enzyme family)
MDTFLGNAVEGRVEQGLAELMRRFAAGEFDLVSIGRSLISDPDWVRKVRDGDYDAIRIFSRAHLKLGDGEKGIVHEAHGLV